MGVLFNLFLYCLVVMLYLAYAFFGTLDYLKDRIKGKNFQSFKKYVFMDIDWR